MGHKYRNYEMKRKHVKAEFMRYLEIIKRYAIQIEATGTFKYEIFVFNGYYQVD